MKCKFCGLKLVDGFQCKVPVNSDKNKFDYAHPGCWIIWSKCQIKLNKITEAYDFNLRAIKNGSLKMTCIDELITD